MDISVFPKFTPQRRRVANGAFSAENEVITLQLLKENVINEDYIVFNYTTITNAGAPTAIDVNRAGKLIKKLVLRASGKQDGELFNLSGLTAFIVNGVHEKAPAALSSLGVNSTIQFAIELHHANNKALRDMMTSLDGKSATGLTLEITMASFAEMRSIAGGPFTAAAAFTAIGGTVEIISSEIPERKLAGVVGVGVGRHFLREQLVPVVGAGQVQIDLQVGNKCRGILIMPELGTGVASDALATNLALQIGGETIFDESYFSQKLRTSDHFNIDTPGAVYIAFSDSNETGWLDLYNTNQARITVNTALAGNLRVLQDYSEGLVIG